jgi:DNA-binding MarR family transcriptional regulator
VNELSRHDRPRREAAVNDEELRAAVRVIARLGRVLECTPAPLTMTQYRLLALAEADVSRCSRLARGLLLTKPAVSGTVDALAALGLLLRVPDPADRRASHIELTEAGVRALRTTEAALGDSLQPLFTGTSDPGRLLSILEELETVLDRAREGG